MNALTKLQPKTLTNAQILATLAGVASQHANTLDQFMNFDGRVGRYTIPSSGGGEPETFAINTKVLVNIFECTQGYSCWKGGTVVDKAERSIFDAPLDPNTLEDHGPYDTDPQKREGWAPYVVVLLKDPATGKQYKLRLSSVSARDSWGKLVDDIRSQATMHDLQAETPLVSLGAEAFRAKGQRNYKPRFEIVSWEKNPVEEAAAAPAAIAAPTEEATSAIPASRRK